MAVWISTTNYAKGITATTSSAAASGYSAADLADGVLGRAWRTTTGAVSHDFTFDLGVVRAVSLVCLFDVDNNTAANSWANPAVTASYAAALGGPYTSAGTANFTTRGDCMLDVRSGGAAIAARYWKITVVPNAVGAIDVGEIWIGTLQVLTRGFADRNDALEYRTIVNESETGNEFATAVADARYRFKLGWDAMTSSDLAEFQTVQTALGGRRSPCVLVPDSSAGVAYHGRFGDELSWQHDDPIRKGVGLEFVESGRAL